MDIHYISADLKPGARVPPVRDDAPPVRGLLPHVARRARRQGGDRVGRFGVGRGG